MSNNANVLIITRWYVSEWKACTIRVMYLARALLEKGYDTSILILKSPYEYVRFQSLYDEKIVVVNFISIPRRLFLDSLSPILSTITVLKKLNSKPEVVIATVPPHDTAFVAYYLKKLGYADKLIVDIRGTTPSLMPDVYGYKLPKLQLLLSTFGVEFYHRVLREADAVVSITEGFAKYYEPIAEKPIYVIHNGADYELFSKYSNTTMSNYPPLAVFVGDVEAKYHLVDVMLKAVSLLRRKGLDIKLRIIGCSSKVKEYYQGLAKSLGMLDLVEFVGVVPYFNLPRYVCGGSFGIVGRPNVLEWKLTIPVKVYEYIACGLPVFAFGPPGSELQFFIERFGLGVYVPSNDVNVLADKLVEFVKNLDSYDRRRIFEVAKFFDRRRWARRFAEIIENLL